MTHHQRKLVDLAKHHLFGDPEEHHKYAVNISADDKAYIRPETSGNIVYVLGSIFLWLSESLELAKYEDEFDMFLIRTFLV